MDPSAERPPRPDLRPGSSMTTRGGWATLVVVGMILAVVLGGYVVAAALSQPVGATVDVAEVVRIHPLSGWAVARRGTIAGAPFAQITRGSGNLEIAALARRGGDAERLATDYARIVLSPRLSQLSTSTEIDVTLRSGLSGVRFAYVGVESATGASIEGEVTAVVAPSGNGVVFDGWGPAGSLSFIRSDIDAMIADAEVR